MLTISTPAVDTMLLTIEQLRLAAGLDAADDGQDVPLTALGERVSAEICTACNVAIGVGAPPTLRQETLTQTYRMQARNSLILSRRHEVEIASVTVDDVAYDPSAYEVDPESGILMRLSDFCRIPWYFRSAAVVYQAGFATVPDDLAGVAYDLARVRLSEQARDPLVRSTDVLVPDVEEVTTTYWINAATAGPVDAVGALPADITARLKRYFNVTVG